MQIRKLDAATVIRSVRGALDGLDAGRTKTILDAIKGAFGTAARRDDDDEESEPASKRSMRSTDLQPPTSEADKIAASFGDDDPALRPKPARKGFQWPRDMNQDESVAQILEFFDEKPDPAQRQVESIGIDPRKVGR